MICWQHIYRFLRCSMPLAVGHAYAFALFFVLNATGWAMPVAKAADQEQFWVTTKVYVSDSHVSWHLLPILPGTDDCEQIPIQSEEEESKQETQNDFLKLGLWSSFDDQFFCSVCKQVCLQLGSACSLPSHQVHLIILYHAWKILLLY